MLAQEPIVDLRLRLEDPLLVTIMLHLVHILELVQELVQVFLNPLHNPKAHLRSPKGLQTVMLAQVHPRCFHLHLMG